MNEYTIHVYPTVAGMLLLVVCHLTMGNIKMSQMIIPYYSHTFYPGVWADQRNYQGVYGN